MTDCEIIYFTEDPYYRIVKANLFNRCAIRAQDTVAIGTKHSRLIRGQKLQHDSVVSDRDYAVRFKPCDTFGSRLIRS